MSEDRETLVRYRLEQAAEAVRAAQLLHEHGDYRGCLNRAYYAMFYAVLALLADRGQKTSKHAGALALFDREFIKQHVLPDRLSEWLHEAFARRQRADYHDLVQVPASRAKRTLRRAGQFVATVREKLEEARPNHPPRLPR